MTTEDLMKPRYKVIALWPNTEYKIGSILQPDYFIEKTIKFCETYPHLFRKLEWWEDRDEKDMPLYLRAATNKNLCLVVEHFCGVKQSEAWCYFPELNGKHYVRYRDVEPATLEEYTQYTNKQKQS
jgi:hypothetical protein